MEGVVAGRNHDAAVKLVHLGDVRHAGRGGDVHQAGVRTGGRDAGGQGALKHIAGPAGVFSDHDLALVVPAVVPAQEAAHLKSVVHGEGHVGLAAKTVRTKIFRHSRSLQIHNSYLRICMVRSQRNTQASSCVEYHYTTSAASLSILGFRIEQKRQPKWLSLLCWRYLFFRPVSRQVSSAQVSLTSVFGMGTGGPSLQSTPTRCPKTAYIIFSRFVKAKRGDPYGNRTHVCGVRGRRLNRLTNGPLVHLQGLEPWTP